MFGALQVGMKLHAMWGADGKYYPSEVVSLAKSKNPVKVHYIGYETTNDAWVSMDMLKYKLKEKKDYSSLTKGMRLQAKTDGKFLAAEVVAVSENTEEAPVDSQRETAAWEKMHQMEIQIQQLLERTGEEADKKAEEVERQVAGHVAAAMQKLEELLKRQTLDTAAEVQALKASDLEKSSQLEQISRNVVEFSEMKKGIYADLEACRSVDRSLEASLRTSDEKISSLESQCHEGFVEVKSFAQEVADKVSGLAERIETAHEPSIDSLRLELSQELDAEVQTLKHWLQQVQDSNDEACSEVAEALRQASAETAALSCRSDIQEAPPLDFAAAETDEGSPGTHATGAWSEGAGTGPDQGSPGAWQDACNAFDQMREEWHGRLQRSEQQLMDHMNVRFQLLEQEQIAALHQRQMEFDLKVTQMLDELEDHAVLLHQAEEELVEEVDRDAAEANSDLAAQFISALKEGLMGEPVDGSDYGL